MGGTLVDREQSGKMGVVLLSIPSPSVSSFSLGPLTIHIYALCILTGIAVAWILGSRRWVARGGTAETFESIIIWAIVAGIVGARLYHVLTHWGDYFGPGRDPLTALYIWQGGLAIFGGILAGALAVWWGCRRHQVRLAPLADAIAPGLLFAQAIGRVGNWFNQELFGGPDNGPLGVEISPGRRPAEYADVATFQPTFLYELCWNTAGGLILLVLDRKFKLGYGKLFSLYMVVYGAGRFYIEGIRTDFSYLVGPLRTNQVAALVFIVVGSALFAALTKLRPGQESTVALPDGMGEVSGDGVVADVDGAEGGKESAGGVGEGSGDDASKCADADDAENADPEVAEHPASGKQGPV